MAINNENPINVMPCFLQVEVDYIEEEIAISRYHLSAALTCAKVCSGFEEVWGIK